MLALAITPLYAAAVHAQTSPAKEFVEQVMPVLQQRGLFRKEYEGTTLRENLGFDYPVSRYVGKPAEPSDRRI